MLPWYHLIDGTTFVSLAAVLLENAEMCEHLKTISNNNTVHILNSTDASQLAAFKLGRYSRQLTTRTSRWNNAQQRRPGVLQL